MTVDSMVLRGGRFAFRPCLQPPEQGRLGTSPLKKYTIMFVARLGSVVVDESSGRAGLLCWPPEVVSV